MKSQEHYLCTKTPQYNYLFNYFLFRVSVCSAPDTGAGFLM